MCEPTHSIVQYPDQDDNGDPTQPKIEAGMQSTYGKLMDWGKKILGWLHYSRMGSGHSEALSLAGTHSGWLPEEQRYEGLWWNREVIRDGEAFAFYRKMMLTGQYQGIEVQPLAAEAFQKEQERESLEAATEYANRVSIGSLSCLRRFLESSLKYTDNHYGYIHQFHSELLNWKGRDQFDKKLKVCGLYGSLCGIQSVRHNPSMLDRLIKIILGFTRKRELLNDAWSDSSLWVPKKEIITV